jgi:hypothetical protein
MEQKPVKRLNSEPSDDLLSNLNQKSVNDK